jgi:hypothetical protein
VRLRLGAALTSTIAIGFGLLTLAGLLAGEDAGLLSTLTNVFLQLVVITIAFTILIGIVNLLFVHLGRIFGRKRGALYSLVLVLSFLLVIVTYAAQRDTSLMLLETVQVSVESALAGLLYFALVYGAYRMMRRRVTIWGTLFITVLLVVLIGSLPIPGLSFAKKLSDWLVTIPVSAGARGILLGIALATILTGVRVLTGQDRSYRE